MQPEFQRLSGIEIATAKVRCRSAGAGKGDRLSTLERCAPHDAPASDGLVCKATGIRHEVLALAEWKLVTAAEMENIANIKIRQAIVKSHSETRNARGAETGDASA